MKPSHSSLRRFVLPAAALVLWGGSGCRTALRPGAPRPAGAGVFQPDRRLFTTYFFSRGPWDNRPPGRNGGPWPEIFPAPGDPLAAAYGLDSPDKWPGHRLPDATHWPADYRQRRQYPLWLMAEWRAMKWCRFDFVLVDVWPCLWFHKDGSPKFAFRALAQAWKELDRRGENPLPMALFLETPFGWINPKLDGDATQNSTDGIAELWDQTRAFLRQFYGEGDTPPILPLRALARVEKDGEARPILHFWFPYWPPKHGHGIRKWNAWTFRELRKKCRETFGVEPYIGVNQHVHGRRFIGGWNSVQPAGGMADIDARHGIVDYDVDWWAGLLGPRFGHNAIAIGAGHWMLRQHPRRPPSPRWDPKAYAPDQYRYLHNWRQVLNDARRLDARLLIVESWNNTLESCAICGCRPDDYTDARGRIVDRWGKDPGQYMRWTRRLAPYWKSGRRPPVFPPWN